MEKKPISEQVEILKAVIDKMHTEINAMQQLMLKTSKNIPEIVYIKFRMMAKACSVGAEAIKDQLPKEEVERADKLVENLTFVSVASVQEVKET